MNQRKFTSYLKYSFFRSRALTDLIHYFNFIRRLFVLMLSTWFFLFLGYVTSLLNWPVFMPLSKLTYSAYLVHYFVLQWYLAIQDAPLRYSTMNLAYFILGNSKENRKSMPQIFFSFLYHHFSSSLSILRTKSSRLVIDCCF